MQSSQVNDLLMDDLIEDHLGVLAAEGKSINTITDRRRVLRRLQEDLPYGILAACREQLQAWLGYEKWSRRTRAVYAYHMFAFVDWLEDRGFFPNGKPTKGMRHPKRPRAVAKLVPAQVVEVALDAPEPLYTAVLLARYQGLRRCEAAACLREDVTERVTYVRDAKGGDPQTVPTHPAVWEHVKDRPPGPLVTRHGQPITADQLGHIALRYFRSRGLYGMGLHDLRRWFGREVYQRTGHNLRVTQQVLRHANISPALQVYLGVTEDETFEAVTAIPHVRTSGLADIQPGRPDAA